MNIERYISQDGLEYAHKAASEALGQSLRRLDKSRVAGGTSGALAEVATALRNFRAVLELMEGDLWGNGR